MRAEPISLLVCDLTRNGLTGTFTLTVSVPRLGGKRKKGGRYKSKDAVTVYDVRVSPRFVFLTRRDTGQLYTVTKAGRRCSCNDAAYRQRGLVSFCKHVRAVEAVGLLPDAV